MTRNAILPFVLTICVSLHGATNLVCAQSDELAAGDRPSRARRERESPAARSTDFRLPIVDRRATAERPNEASPAAGPAIDREISYFQVSDRDDEPASTAATYEPSRRDTSARLEELRRLIASLEAERRPAPERASSRASDAAGEKNAGERYYYRARRRERDSVTLPRLLDEVLPPGSRTGVPSRVPRNCWTWPRRSPSMTSPPVWPSASRCSSVELHLHR